MDARPTTFEDIMMGSDIGASGVDRPDRIRKRLIANARTTQRMASLSDRLPTAYHEFSMPRLALAQGFTVVYESPSPTDVFCYTPGIARSAGGRLIATLDLGGEGVANFPGPKGSRAGGSRFGMGKVFVSDDRGATWSHRTNFPFWHARPFFAEGVLYVLGQAGDIMIMRSSDEGDTWSNPVTLTKGQKWHGSACNVLYYRKHIYLALDQRKDLSIKGWNVAGLAPRVLRAPVGADLLDPLNWTISTAPAFNEIVPNDAIDWFGVPFYRTPQREPVQLGSNKVCSPMGWLEPNLVRFTDPHHIWHDSEGRTLHLILRTNTGGTGYGALVKVVEHEDGTMTTEFEGVPSGKTTLFVPMPGGHLKFHILYDSVSELYWLIGSQATDSMTRLTDLPEVRYNLPNNERHRLQLHFSKNCIDWCFAGIVAAGRDESHARNYPSMAIDGEDLLVLCRSGDHRALDPQYTNLITFHRIRDFRSLIY